MTDTTNLVVFACPACGPLAADQFDLYQPGMFNAQSKRFGPWCRACGARALPLPGPFPARAPLLLLSGSCASGKSTISFLLSERHGFAQIDGDWVLQLAKEEYGKGVDYTSIDPPMLACAAALSALGMPSVIAQIVLPARMPYYERYCAERGIPFRAAVLLPREDVLLARNRERVCWPKTTPEQWVLKFQRDLYAAPASFARWYDDNSCETPEQTATRLAASLLPAD